VPTPRWATRWVTAFIALTVASLTLVACGGSEDKASQPATAVQDAASRNIQVTFVNNSTCPVQLSTSPQWSPPNTYNGDTASGPTTWISGAPSGQFNPGTSAEGTGYGISNIYEADFVFQGPANGDSALAFVNPNTGDPGFQVMANDSASLPFTEKPQNQMGEGSTVSDNFQLYCLAAGEVPSSTYENGGFVSTTPIANASVTRENDTSSYKVFVVTLTN
jgi:hypothetical protein